MKPSRKLRHDYDPFWKEALDAFLPEHLALLAPRLHRAIDWLSTMPQVVHLALGVWPASPGPG